MHTTVMDAAAVAAASAGQTEQKEVHKRRRDSKVPRKRHVMRLLILSGSFFPPASASAGGGYGAAAAMDASVWSRLPDDMVWRVLGFVPPAKRFQLHLVSRKWRQVLTSPHFRNTIAAAPQQQQRVVACVSPVEPDARPRSRLEKLNKVVDVDLSSLVPSWFWKRHLTRCPFPKRSFSVVAAGDGLVCICNHLGCRCDLDVNWRPLPDRPAAATGYCVINPLTRTCVVLPPAPGPFRRPLPFPPVLWLPLSGSAGALTMYRWDGDEYEQGWEMATCDLAAAAAAAAAGGGASAGGSCWSVLHSPPVPAAVPGAPVTRSPPVLAQCGSELFWYHARRLHVLAAPQPEAEAVAGGAKRRRLERVGGAGVGVLQVVEALDGPSVAQLGLDAATIGYEPDHLYLVAHRGAIVLVAQLLRRLRPDQRRCPPGLPPGVFSPYTWDPELVAGVWQLARRGRSPGPEEAMAWEPVSRLDLRQVKRLVQSEPPLRGAVVVCGAFVVGDQLCLELGAFYPDPPKLDGYLPREFVLRLDHDAGDWERLVDDQRLVEWDYARRRYPRVVELRPQ